MTVAVQLMTQTTKLALFSWLLVSASSLSAQDRVTHTPAGSTGSVVTLGEIVDYTGRSLIVRTANGLQHLDSALITGLETTYNSAHLRGLNEFQQSETLTAQSSFRDALKDEQRPWVQRELHAWLLKCALRRNDLSGAIREFRVVASTDPLTRHWGAAPLVWSPTAISAEIRNDMAPLLTSDLEHERLLAASLLLLDPGQGELAEKQLNLLTRSANPILSSYSTFQLRRLDIARQNVSDVQVKNWSTDIDRLRPELRCGPQYLLSRAYAVRGDSRLAAAEALWLPYLYPQNEPLAARALSDAAENLQRSGLNSEAAILELELIQRYPWSKEALQRPSTIPPPSVTTPVSGAPASFPKP